MNFPAPETITAVGAIAVMYGSVIQMNLAKKEQDAFYRNQAALKATYVQEYKIYSRWSWRKRSQARKEVEAELGSAFDEFREQSKAMTRFAKGWSCITVGSAALALGAVMPVVGKCMEIFN